MKYLKKINEFADPEWSVRFSPSGFGKKFAIEKKRIWDKFVENSNKHGQESIQDIKDCLYGLIDSFNTVKDKFDIEVESMASYKDNVKWVYKFEIFSKDIDKLKIELPDAFNRLKEIDASVDISFYNKILSIDELFTTVELYYQQGTDKLKDVRKYLPLIIQLDIY